MKHSALLLSLLCSVTLCRGDAAGQGITQQAYLKASNAAFLDHFGSAAALSGDTLVISAWREDSAATGVNGDQGSGDASDSGAAYVFVQDGSGWSQQAYLKASNTGLGDEFGRSVAISGDTIVVGAWSESSSATGVNGDGTNNGAAGAGAAYVFVRNGTTWSQQAYLKASNTDANDRFGQAVSISGDTIVVGAYGERSHATGVNGDQGDNSTSGAGAAYVFVRSGSSWTQQAYLKPSTAQTSHVFGWSVASSGDTVVVGAYGDASGATGVDGNQSDNSAPFSGAAYVFVRTGTTWTQQAYLKASNTGASDGFAQSVALSGDTLVVGASAEDSTALGVNGDQSDNGAWEAGAAYVFVRSGATWSQQAYLKASNTEAKDYFGLHVALSGDTVLVGADHEDSRSTGVNGSQGDNNAPEAGAAYLFVRNGANWSQQAYLKASNTEGYDSFGYSVAVSRDTAVIGAETEWSAATGVNGDQSDNSAFGAGAAYAFDLGLDGWMDLSSGLAGTAGLPLLAGSGPLTAGSANQLDLTHAKPSASATLVVGVALLDAPFKGGTMVPLPLRLISLGTNASGALSLPFTWPASVPAGSTLYYQCWISDPAGVAGFSASNGLKSVSS